MKILYTADLHIKIGQKNVPRQWQRDRYEMFFNKLHALESKCDALIIGGDIFDKAPNPEELGMYFDLVAGCTIPTYIYDGNHEAARKGKTFLEHLSKATNIMNDNVQIILHNGYAFLDGNVDFIPYNRLREFNPKQFKSKILCTHVRGAIPPHVIPEIDLDLLNRWEVVLAGDLHSHDNSQRNIIYPGSPLSITFHRNKIKNGVIIFDTDTMQHEFIDLELPQLLRKSIETEDEIVRGTYDHIIYEITGNVLDLSGVNSDLIDKKIIKTTNTAKLNLANMKIADELKLYFEQILSLSDADVIDTLRVFSDYYKEP